MCIKGECFCDECFSDKFRRIFNGSGCNALDVEEDTVVYYYKLHSFPVNGNSKKCKVQVPLIWPLFKQKYINTLE